MKPPDSRESWYEAYQPPWKRFASKLWPKSPPSVTPQHRNSAKMWSTGWRMNQFAFITSRGSPAPGWLRRHRTMATSGVATLAVAAVLLTTATLLLNTKNTQLEQANANERAANDELAKANRRERAAKELAEANFSMAKDAVEKYLSARSPTILT